MRTARLRATLRRGLAPRSSALRSLHPQGGGRGGGGGGGAGGGGVVGGGWGGGGEREGGGGRGGWCCFFGFGGRVCSVGGGRLVSSVIVRGVATRRRLPGESSRCTRGRRGPLRRPGSRTPSPPRRCPTFRWTSVVWSARRPCARRGKAAPWPGPRRKPGKPGSNWCSPFLGKPSRSNATARRVLDVEHRDDLLVHQAGPARGSVTGALAGEALADVDRRLAVDERPCPRAAGRPRPGRTRRRRSGRTAPAPPGRPRSSGGPTIAISLRRRQVEVERVQRAPNSVGRARRGRAEQAEHADGAPLELVVAVDPREPQQDVGEHRVPRRHRVVDEVLLARDQPLAVGGREEEAAALVVAEQLDREQREPVRDSSSQRSSPVATCSS